MISPIATTTTYPTACESAGFTTALAASDDARGSKDILRSVHTDTDTMDKRTRSYCEAVWSTSCTMHSRWTKSFEPVDISRASRAVLPPRSFHRCRAKQHAVSFLWLSLVAQRSKRPELFGISCLRYSIRWMHGWWEKRMGWYRDHASGCRAGEIPVPGLWVSIRSDIGHGTSLRDLDRRPCRAYGRVGVC